MSFCSKCGAQLEPGSLFCSCCGTKVEDSSKPAENTQPVQQVPVAQPVAVQTPGQCSSKSRTTALLLGIFLGCCGAHNFYLKKTGRAVAQLCLWLLGFICVFVPIINMITASNSYRYYDRLSGDVTAVIVGYILVIAVGIWSFVEWILIACGSAKDGNGLPVKSWEGSNGAVGSAVGTSSASSSGVNSAAVSGGTVPAKKGSFWKFPIIGAAICMMSPLIKAIDWTDSVFLFCIAFIGITIYIQKLDMKKSLLLGGCICVARFPVFAYVFDFLTPVMIKIFSKHNISDNYYDRNPYFVSGELLTTGQMWISYFITAVLIMGISALVSCLVSMRNKK